MAEFFSEYGLFLAKTLTLVLAIVFILMMVMASAMKGKKNQEKGTLEVVRLNDEIDDLKDTLRHSIIDKHILKSESKAEKKAKKAEKSRNKNKDDNTEEKKRVFVLDFDGDVKASQVDSLSKCITAVLTMARESDEVLLKLESPGGMVHSYGLASAQLKRLRDKNIPLTICVDKVAASGGYMMACLGTRIVASPFAYVGSIGVLMQLPNFHRLLQENNVDYEMITAGEYKRTLTMFGENTDKGREKVAEEIQEAHQLFKDFIRENRPSLDVEQVATGETWFGQQALTKGLVDDINTSDDCIMEACKTADVFEVSYEIKQPLSKKLGSLMENTLDKAFLNWVQKTSKYKFFS